jgi:ADP-ribosylglycohydrolase
MNKLILALLTVSAIASAAVPANAQNTGNSSVINQESRLEGNGNRSTQQAIQSGLREHYRNSGDFANIQEINQFCDAYGNRNECVQQAIQDFQERRPNARPRRNVRQ